MIESLAFFKPAWSFAFERLTYPGYGILVDRAIETANPMATSSTH